MNFGGVSSICLSNVPSLPRIPKFYVNSKLCSRTSMSSRIKENNAEKEVPPFYPKVPKMSKEKMIRNPLSTNKITDSITKARIKHWL